MPSRPAVLREIAARGLDPKKEFTKVNGGGKLKIDNPVHAEEKVVPVKPVVHHKEEKPEPKAGLVHVHCDDCSKVDPCGCECKTCTKVTKKKAEKKHEEKHEG